MAAPLFSLLLAYALVVSAVLGRMTCEELDSSTCAFAVSSSGLRCFLEKHLQGTNRVDGYECRSSGVKANVAAGLVETDECVADCGLDRKMVGFSSDSLLDRRFMRRLCSPECYLNCPNVVDHYFSAAAGDGVFLPNLCQIYSVGMETPERRRSASGSESLTSSKLGGHITYFTPPVAGRYMIKLNEAGGCDASPPIARRNHLDSDAHENTTTSSLMKGPDWR